jgi:hypothetical protein
LGRAGTLRASATDRVLNPGELTRTTPVADGQEGSVFARLSNGEAFLSRGDLRTLGLERRAIDAVFRACPIVVLPGYSRPLIRVEDYRALIEANTHRGDRIR